MLSLVDILKAVTFCGVTTALFLFLALRTEDIFRALGGGMYEQNKPSAGALRFMKNLGIFGVAGSVLTLIFKLLGLMG